jgi:hypothetical protein
LTNLHPQLSGPNFHPNITDKILSYIRRQNCCNQLKAVNSQNC